MRDDLNLEPSPVTSVVSEDVNMTAGPEELSEAVEEDLPGAVKEEFSGAVEEKHSVAVKEELSGAVKEDIFGAVDEKHSVVVKEELSGAVEEELSVAVEEELSGAMEEDLSEAVEDKHSVVVEEELSGTVEEELSGAVEEELSGAVEKELSVAVEEELSGAVEEGCGTKYVQDTIADCDVEPVPDGYEDYLNEEKEPECVSKWIRDMIYDTPRLDWSKVQWSMVAFLVFIHGVTLLTLDDMVMFRGKWQTTVFSTLNGFCSGFGVTVGAHRLWSHHSFQPCLLVRWVLMYWHSMACQESILTWSHLHRVHHKWVDTDADFTNATRGFFFAHMGWYMYEQHPAVKEGMKKIDISDLMKLSEVRFQHKYYHIMALCTTFVIPTMFKYLVIGEDPWLAAQSSIVRLVVSLHLTWIINSFAHLGGTRPYDKNLMPGDSSVLGPLSLGEGYHNYHHAFPRDYRASEINGYFFNLSTSLIELFNWLGLAHRLTTVSERIVTARSNRSGDPSLRPKNQKATEMVYVTPKNSQWSSILPELFCLFTTNAPVKKKTESYQEQTNMNGNDDSEATEKKNV